MPYRQWFGGLRADGPVRSEAGKLELGADFQLTRTAANIATPASGDKIRFASNMISMVPGTVHPAAATGTVEPGAMAVALVGGTANLYVNIGGTAYRFAAAGTVAWS
jgi:hypothetical protein